MKSFLSVPLQPGDTAMGLQEGLSGARLATLERLKQCNRRPVTISPVQFQDQESLLLRRKALCTAPLTMGGRTGLSQTQL